MSREDDLKLVNAWYESLATGNLDQFRAIHSEDAVYNISGHTPISGQVSFPDLLQHVLPVVFGALDQSRFRFCTRHKIVCADDTRIVGVMEADGPATNGVRYDQRYVHMFTCRDGKISTVWEFFDTALANAAMFHLPNMRIPGVDHDRFDL